MAKAKLKMTGFARFFLVMLVLAPASYIGASYYNGEDGIQNIIDFFSGKGKDNTEVVETPVNNPVTAPAQPSETVINAEIAKLKDDLATKNELMNTLYQENAELKKQVKDQEEELEEVKKQLEKIKSAIGG